MAVRGTALDTGGKPVAGLRVDVDLGALGSVEAVTDDGGVFELPVDAPARGTAAIVRGWIDDRLVHVQDAVLPGLRLSMTIEVVEPFAERRRLFARALSAGKPVAGVTIGARDGSGVHGVQEAVTGRGGRFTLLYDPGRSSPVLWLSLVANGITLVSPGPLEWMDLVLETDVEVAEADAMEVTGRVTERGTGTGVDGVVVELLDRALLWPNPVATSAETSASGEFSITFPRVLDPLPLPTLRATRRGVAVASMDADPAWSGGTLRDVSVVLAPAEQLPSTYRLDGQALDRRTRLGVTGLRVEVWASGFGSMLGAGITDPEGRFAVAFAAGSATEAPRVAVRVYDGSKLMSQTDNLDVAWSALGEAMTFVEVDADGVAPRSFVVSGRVLDTASHAGLPGLRVEAWDRLPRDGGNIGVAADTSGDGSFQLSVPAPTPVAERLLRRPDLGRPLAPFPYAGPTLERLAGPIGSTGSTMPSLIFRIYGDDRLVATLNPTLTWTPNGTAVVVLEIAAPLGARSTEVGLHELGENLATTVDRVQHELSRYPSSMGAYVLDEIDLEFPVDLRVDQLGQVRTTVLDSSTATDRAVGRVHMRVKPVLGAAARPVDVPDQPLVVLEELSADAIRKLAGLRIYSVEDLVRAAQSGGGRAALVALDLDVDLGVLLAKAGLLALPTLPRAVREALVGLGFADVKAFLDVTAHDELAAKLTTALGQEVAAAHIVTWQEETRRYLFVPLPEEAPE